MTEKSDARDLSVRIERTLGAEPGTVFRALTDEGLYGRWMGPRGSAVTVLGMDPRTDGEFSFRVELPDGGPEFVLGGVYREVECPRRLVHTWATEGSPGETMVSYELEEADGGTRLVLTDGPFPDAEDRERNVAGWNHQLDRLDELVTAVAGGGG